MKVSAKLIRIPYFIYFFSSAIFLLMCLFFVQNIPMSESVHFWLDSEHLDEALHSFWHPPVYIVLLHFFRVLFSGSYVGGYVLGILSVLFSGFLIYKIIAISESKIDETPSVLMMVLLGYYSLPVVTQGAFIFDIDNTILTPILLLIYFLYIKFSRDPKWANGILLFLVILLSFWVKATTQVLLLCSIFLFHLIKGDFRFLLFKLVPVFGIAILSFYISYGWLYSEYVLGGKGSFQYNQGKALFLLSGNYTFKLPLRDFVFSIASNLGAIVIWSSPIMAVLIATLFIWIIKDQKLLTLKWIGKPLDQKYMVPAIFTMAIIVAYSILMKVQPDAGFPKYHYPLFPFFFTILGAYLVRSKVEFHWFDFGFFFIMLVAISLLTKDILYPFYELGREKQMNLLFILFAKICLFMFAPVVVYVAIRKKTKIKTIPDFLKVLMVFALIVNFSGLIYRSQADYSTNYHYGIRGTDEALAYAKTIPINQSVYFPYVGFLLDRPAPTKTASWGRLLGESEFKPNTDFIIFTDTMMNRNKFFFGIDQVKDKYERVMTIQSYGVWQKKLQ